MTLPDPAYATRADVERAVRRRLLALHAGQDPVDAVMGIVGPVIEAKDARYARVRAERVGDSAT